MPTPKRFRKPRFLNQLEKRRLKRQGLFTQKRSESYNPPSNILGVQQGKSKHTLNIQVIDERTGTEEFEEKQETGTRIECSDCDAFPCNFIPDNATVEEYKKICAECEAEREAKVNGESQ